MEYRHDDNIYINTNVANSLEDFKTWLSTNNIQVDYELETPVTEEYGYLTILQLVDGENNISNSVDANMIIDYVDNKLIVNNLGNYEAKPVITIKGAGTIELIVNDNKLFRYTFPDGEDTVIIDSQKQDAYLDTVLKNRNMTGEFPTLKSGRNKINLTGNITEIYLIANSRWL